MDLDSPPTTLYNMDELTRAPDLWFEDCGLIIQAEKTIFRVSRDFLALQSPVFRDMLSLPPPKTADMMLGCPFVFLPDSAQDVTVFLKALIFHDFFEPYPAPTSLDVLIGVLRLSHKYEVHSLRKRALVHISAGHPTSLEAYDAWEQEPQPAWLLEAIDRNEALLPILARQLSIPWILPIAFYHDCKHMSERCILKSPQSLEDKTLVITACRTLEGTAVSEMLNFLWADDEPEDEDCVSPIRCMVSRTGMRRIAEGRRERSTATAPIFPLEIWRPEDWDALFVCGPCLASMKDAYEGARKAFWDDLPDMFDLPPWDELEKLKAEALK
ncbi:BTB domain-containing protein [Favolaschia claudopus]|uniref:BTB domain-containing protein n=1 Tax=Favolaschia claudopus TaxID=2862362 RepID=A0AAW0DH26_9AGAR